MVEALLDSVIIIDHLNGVAEATDWLAAEDWETLAVSPITRAEVLAGAHPDEAVHIGHFLDSFSCLPMNAQSADRAATLRREKRLRLPDAFQAALAELHNISLVTRNTRDFPKASFEFVVVPYEV